MHGPPQSLAAPSALDAAASKPNFRSRAASKSKTLDFRLIQSIDQLDEIANDWIQLAEISSGSPFRSFAWNRAWFRHFSDDYDEMAVFSFARDGQTVAIFPFYREGRCLRLAADSIGDLQDAIAADEDAASEGLRQVFRWARKNGCHLKMLQVSERGRLHQAARALGLLRNRALRFQRCYSSCFFTDLPDSADAWVQQLPRKVRGDMRRHVNKLDRQHPDAKIRIHRAGDTPEAVVREVADFHDAHFRKDGVSLMSDPRFVDLISEAAQSRDSGLRISTLKDGDRTLAVDVGFTHDRTYHGFLTAFDPAFRKISPGSCLLMKRLDWFINEDGVRSLDFLLGAERYKSQFARENYQVCAFYLFPWGIANAFRWASVIAKRAIKLLAKKTLADSAIYKTAKAKYHSLKEKRSAKPARQFELVEHADPKQAERDHVERIARGANRDEAGKRDAA